MSKRLILTLIVIAIALALIMYTILDLGNTKTKLRIAITTSLYVSGLPRYLADYFEKLYQDVELIFIVTGSNTALEHAKRGNACIVFAHAPKLELEYLRQGVVKYHKLFVFNIFVVVGPRDDPANVSNASDILDAFKKIYSAAENGKVIFISRGDRSGTHEREYLLWNLIGVLPSYSWYKECGCSADQLLLIANEFKAYALTDIATYDMLKRSGRISNIDILYINYIDPLAVNIYSVYIAKNCNSREERYAKLFIDFIYENQDLINKFIEKNNITFYPVRDREYFLEELWKKFAEGGIIG